MIVFEAMEVPSTLKERISRSEAKVERLNSKSLNATLLIPLSFILTMGLAVAGSLSAEAFGFSSNYVIIPLIPISLLMLRGSFKVFDRASDSLEDARAELVTLLEAQRSLRKKAVS